MKPSRKKNSSAAPASTTRREQSAARTSFPIVGIGASAGGLEAFSQLLNNLPRDTGMAFVLVQHLDPHHPSLLSNLLAKTTSMPVSEVKDGMSVKPNHVYVIPPNKNMNLVRGRLRLSPRGRSRLATSVDHFFSSLAEVHEACAIGVILSGTGSDGTVGLTRIKAMGGITFAQDEKSAKFAGMPAHAKLDSVDFIMPPEQIARELARIAEDLHLTGSAKPKNETQEMASERSFLRILSLLRMHTGADLSQYRDTTIKRRIERRMLVRNEHTFEKYIALLEKNPEEITDLFNDVLINVTSFFRDPEMFEALKTSIFPQIVRSKPPTIRIWVPACSTGQEAYSIAIVLLEFLEQTSHAPAIQIFATDIRETSINTGRRGVYAEGIVDEVSPERLRRFFTKEDGEYRISKAIRDLCVFATQNVLSDPPFSRIDLVSCRNVLIYMTPPLQRRVISTFHYALNPNGHLVLGNSETVGTNSDLFQLADRKHKIYLQKSAAIRPFSHVSSLELKIKNLPSGYPAPATTQTPLDFQKEADRILLGRFAPAGVVINSSLEVLQFRGRTSPYLEPPAGEATFNLLKMARENLSLELATAIREAKRKNTTVRRKVRLNDDDAARKVSLEVIPLKSSGPSENCFLILFEPAIREEAAASPASPEVAVKKIPDTEKDRELKQLRTDLGAAREYLQMSNEQHDAAHEELKCANEEVLSSNEELQSSNEQLGTAKEELQSTNEELQTLNEELRTRNVELTQVNNDLTNLLASVQIPILMLGNDLRVRRFNPAALEFLHLKPTIIGRPGHAIDSALITPGLEKLLVEVIEQVSARELEVRHRDGRWLSLRLHPYRTADNRIEGVIMELVDIDALKRIQEMQNAAAQAAISESEDRFRIAADHAPVLIWLCDEEKKSIWFNQPWQEFTGRTVNRDPGNGWAEGVHPEDLPRCREMFTKEFDARRGFKMEYRRRRHDGEYRWLADQGVPRYQGTKFAGYIGSCFDITERKQFEEKLADSLLREQMARQEAETASRAKDAFFAALSHELRTPLNPVLLIASESAKDRDLPPGVRANFETIRRNIELEARLIDDLLDLTRISNDKLSLDRQPVDAQIILQNVIANIRTELTEKKIEIRLDLAAEHSRVLADSTRLQQVFWNILRNAVKFTPRGGKIFVETDAPKDSGQWRLKIRDTGIGMTPEELARIFRAFAQGDHARASVHRFGGLGLGLAISQRIMELHASRIQAVSEGRDKGSTFILELALVADGAVHPDENIPPDEAPKEKLKKHGLHILLVEDHEPTRTALVKLLARRNYKVSTAANLADARELAGAEKFSFVISDLGLPDGDGCDLMRELRDQYGLKGIALTGYGMEDDIARTRKSGFMMHLTKPVRVQSLERALATFA